MCVSRDERGVRTVNPLFCVCVRIRASACSLEWPDGARRFVSALCEPRILDEPSEREALMYHSAEVVVGLVSERLQSLIAKAEEEAPKSSGRMQSRLEIVSEHRSVFSEWRCVRASREDEDVSLLDFASAQMGGVPSWSMFVCMLDASVLDASHADDVRGTSCALMDALETMIQDSAHRLGEIAVASISDTENETIRSKLASALHEENGWHAVAEASWVDPLSKAWRSGVRRAIACAAWFSREKDGQQKWRTVCASFGWLHDACRVLCDWFAWYSALYEMVDSVSSIQIPPSLHPGWMDPLAWSKTDMSTRTMRYMLRRKETSAIIQASLGRCNMRLAGPEAMRSHSLRTAGAYMFSEEY
jgi:hypothetical protein